MSAIPSTVASVLAKIRSASDYIVNHEYSIEWSGTFASTLNPYNELIETINIPGRSISTEDSRTATSIASKVASETTFEDLEISWRMPKSLAIHKLIHAWMNAAKGISPGGNYISTGYYADYCTKNSCTIKVGTNILCTVEGLYPTNAQAIQMSSEGGELVKFSATFAVDHLEISNPV